MKQDDVLRLAREAGFATGTIDLADRSGSYPLVMHYGNGCAVELERFAELVAAEEREACAKLCESEWSTEDERKAGQIFAREIRALNKTGKGHES